MFAVLHITDFSLQAVLRIERDPVDQPCALIDETRHPPLVIACTPEARAAGVESGQTGPQAMARCAEIILRTAQPDAEAEARASLLAAAFAVSPQIEYTAPGVCTMQVAGLAEEQREPALRAALAQLRQLGLAATAGLAVTPLLALYAARHGRPRPLGPRSFVLKSQFVGSQLAGAMEARASLPACGSAGSDDSSRPTTAEPLQRLSNSEPSAGLRLAEDGSPYQRHEETTASFRPASSRPCEFEFVCIRETETHGFLRNLPLAVAEPPPEIAEILAGWGVRTLGELTALTKADVTQRLGPAGLALWERAAGEVTRPLRMISPPQTFVAAMTVEHEIETLEPLLFLLRRLIDRLALELRNAGFVAGEMTLGLMLADETFHTREFRLPEPTAREEILFRVLHTHLETLHTATSVCGVSLECRPVRPLARQQGLFESALRDPHGFAETLARVATVIGADRVGTPVLENTHRPDAVTLTAPVAVVPAMIENGLRHGLPLRRYRPSISATVELSGQLPMFVWTSLMAGAVRARSGPWRGSGDWWDASRRWGREEWDVELESGGVYRLLLTSEGWFVEGEYD